jgi:hypothetical protein
MGNKFIQSTKDLRKYCRMPRLVVGDECGGDDAFSLVPSPPKAGKPAGGGQGSRPGHFPPASRQALQKNHHHFYS